MHIGFVGLGKMGGNMVLRLINGAPDGSATGGHQVTGYAKDPSPDLASVEGFRGARSLEEMVSGLPSPPVVWVMVPAGKITESVIADLVKLMPNGGTIIDGGNSFFRDTMRRGEGLRANGVRLVDVGTSGGIWGRQIGYCMMVGGDKSDVDLCKPLFDSLAPPKGWSHVGPSGAGHFVKMIHNGIEYGLMEAYAEGFEILHKNKLFDFDLHAIADVWMRGSVIRSWLLELTELMLRDQPKLATVDPYVEDSGEGRWTIMEAMEADVPVPAIAAALFARFESRDPYNFSARFNAGLRKAFGGHAIGKQIEKTSVEQIQPDGAVSVQDDGPH